MSKLVKIAIECPKCSHQYTGDFFRTIWGENEANRSMVMEDRINIAKCPSCGHQFHLPLAMMYVDVQKGFAVWWEPNHDPGIDSDSASYAKMFGVNSFMQKLLEYLIGKSLNVSLKSMTMELELAVR